MSSRGDPQESPQCPGVHPEWGLMAANLSWGGQRAAGGIAGPVAVAATLPRVLQAAARARRHFLITLISFPRWSLISKMQAMVMKPALRQGQSKTSLFILLTTAQPPLLACRICWVLVWLPLTLAAPPSLPLSTALPLPRAVGKANSSSAALLPQRFSFTVKWQLGETLRVCFATFISCHLFLLMSRVLCPGTAAVPGISQPGAQGCADKSGHEVYRS